MVNKPQLIGMELVPCAVCQKETPKSVALSAENQDGVMHFCGVDCYEEWSADQIRQKTQEAGEP